jgi:hypothetical protein
MDTIIRPIPHLWLVPSFYGDIRLEATGPKTTKMIVEKATPREKAALHAFQKYALKKKWVTADSALAIALAAGPTPGVELRGEIEAAIVDVAERIAKTLKPGRKVLSAVKFADGKLQEFPHYAYDEDAPAAPAPAPYREPDPPAKTASPPAPVPPAKTAVKGDIVPAKAVTVAKPKVGCPAPDFVRAEIKAREVLFAFLSPEQAEDWTKYNRFVSVGATTGHRYMVTSRHAKTSLGLYSRSLYDLDEQRPLCVHDWSIPAAEEALTLHLCVSLPGYESYVRYLEE